jgi:septal ring factor EnvC (AmiA/AmiB activator)
MSQPHLEVTAMSDQHIEDIRKELRQRVFERYEKRAAAFATLFTSLLAFTAIFFVFVLLPYVALEHQKRAAARRLDALHGQLEQLRTDVTEQKARLVALTTTLESKNRELDPLRRQLGQKNTEAQQLDERLAASKRARQVKLEERKKLEDQLTALGQVSSSAEKMTVDRDKLVRDLRAFLGELQRDYEARRLAPDSACPDPDPQTRIGCRVKQKVNTQMDGVFLTLQQSVVQPMARIDQAAAKDLDGRLRTVRQHMDTTLLKNPNFWRTVDEKTAFYGSLVTDVTGLLEQLRSATAEAAAKLEVPKANLDTQLAALDTDTARLNQQVIDLNIQSQQLSEARTRLEEESTRIENARAAIENQLRALDGTTQDLTRRAKILEDARTQSLEDGARIEKRISSVQSPFGPLPIDLNGSVLAFPLVVAIGFLACGVMLAGAVSVREAFHRMCREWDPHASVLTDQRVMLIAPLWLDPESPRLKRLATGALVALPAAIAIAGVVLVCYAWSIVDPPTLGGRPTRMAYALGYLAGLVALAIGAWRVRAAWKSYAADRSVSAPLAP